MENNYSDKWKKRGDRTGLIRNALLKSMGYTDADIEKPIIGIVNTWAETNPGHVHFRQLAEAVKRGVWASGGFPLEVNTMSICEVFFDISSLIYRNLLSITTEELIERHPFDGVVLIGGCDKNIPAQLMAAVSANKPTIYLPGGAMLPGSYRGQTLACGTDSRMSGGCFGTQVLHVAPESAVGGPLAIVKDGDIIHLDVDSNLIELEISDAEFNERMKNVKKKTHPDITRGFVKNFIDNVTQADEGCDLTYMQYREEK